MSSPQTQALIFDFDGLILDTETAVYEGWRELYASHGHPLALETWAQCVGSDFGAYDPEADLEKLLSRKLHWHPLHEQRRLTVQRHLEQAEAMPGVRARLHEARELGVPCSVASSSPHEWVDRWLSHLELREFFQNVTCLDDTGKAKPDPSLFQHAAMKLQAAPESVVIFEDSLNGLRAAHAAEMRCVVVPCAVTQHLKFDAAWRQLKSLEEVSLRELLSL
jgi:putative hydrolase of the HAD superfamily